MKTETKDLLKSVGTNAAGTVVGAAVISMFVFFFGKIDLLVVYWKEVSFSILLIFIVVTLSVWFKKILLIEKELEGLKKDFRDSTQFDYSKAIVDVKNELAKKVDIKNSPSIAVFKELQRTVKEVKIFMYAQKGQMGQIIGLLELLKEDIDTMSWNIEEDLEELEKAIANINLKGDTITQIEEQLCRLDDKPKYRFLTSKVRKHYQN